LIENRVLRKTFVPRTTEVTGGWWKLHIVEFKDGSYYPNFTRMVKLRSMKWASRWQEWERSAQKFCRNIAAILFNENSEIVWH
jgi:hypothetical protein